MKQALINNLKTPTAIKNKNYDDILLELKQELLKIDPKIKLIESDNLSLLLEAFAYRELYLRNLINNNIKKMLPHLSSGVDLDNFVSAFYGNTTRLTNEDDKSFYQRAINSLNSYATAGSKASYIFHTKSFDASIYDVLVQSTSAGIVDIYIASTKEINLIKLQEFLSADKVRPLTDQVQVFKATNKNIIINTEVTLYDLKNKDVIQAQILNNQKNNQKIGEDLIFSNLIKSLHIAGVYKINTNISNDITIITTEIAKTTLNLTFREKLNTEF